MPAPRPASPPDPERLLSQAQALCARRECCRHEVAQKLRAKGLSEEQAQALTDRLEEQGFIDEARYARAFAQDKSRFDRWGRVKIRHHLMARGIGPEHIARALEEIPDEPYAEALSQFLRPRLPQPGTPPAEAAKLRAKAVRAALARGYEPQLVYRMARMDEEW